VLEAFDVSVLRLVRVAIGTLALGALGKGQWRMLTPDEMKSLDEKNRFKKRPDKRRRPAECSDR
jgi:16S rRNA U516 pseudouridylate synthase RsuA-like enzyme